MQTGDDSAPKTYENGLQIVYGSRTRRGLTHANEDRHAVAVWQRWDRDTVIQPEGITSQNSIEEGGYLKPMVTAPACIGSARRDTTFNGTGSTEPQSSKDATGKDVEQAGSAYLWTVCDGHDGPEAADFVCKHIGDSFSKIWHEQGANKLSANFFKDKKVPQGEDGKSYARGYALSNALARTFESIDSSFKQYVTVDTGPDGNGPIQTCTAGSVRGTQSHPCVTSLFLTANLMCCAGLGDCKAAILTLEEADSAAVNRSSTGSGAGTNKANTGDTASNGTPDTTQKPTQQFQVTWFSKEHRSSTPKERARIKARGGWFRHGRVGGVLEPTRTIGDFDVKASQPVGVVIATPEVRTFSVTKPALVLIASDGVWDVMDASQLLRTLKKRKRLWRGILSWLGAPLPERRGLMSFGFRRRAKSKEGLEGMLQMPTGGDLCAMADTLVTRAHDLGSDDDCTCVVIFLRPSQAERMPPDVLTELPPSTGARSPKQEPEEEPDDDDDEEYLDEDEEGEEDFEAEATTAQESSSYEYEKWRKPLDPSAPGDEIVEEEEQPQPEKPAEQWEDLSKTTFQVSLVPTQKGVDAFVPAVDLQDAPEVIEKARKRREERRAARERRKKSMEEKRRQDGNESDKNSGGNGTETITE